MAPRKSSITDENSADDASEIENSAGDASETVQVVIEDAPTEAPAAIVSARTLAEMEAGRQALERRAASIAPKQD